MISWVVAGVTAASCAGARLDKAEPDAAVDAAAAAGGAGDGDGDVSIAQVGDGDRAQGDGDGDGDLGVLDGSVVGDGDQGGDGDGDALVVNPCGGVGDFACECGAAACEHGAECGVLDVEVTAGFFDYVTVECPGPAAGGLVRYPIKRPPDEGTDVWSWQCAGMNLLICKRSDGDGEGCTPGRCPAGNCSGC